jgi:predicted TPR repeat methyltransferase
MMHSTAVLWVATDYCRRRMREDGMQPAAAAAFARTLGLSPDDVRVLATKAENACKAARVTLAAEAAGRALRGEQEPGK